MLKKTIYINIGDIGTLEKSIMKVIDDWAHRKKTPIPLKLIISTMGKKGTIPPTTIKAINSLLKKGYIRRAVTISNKSYFVQLRGV
jgi:predicted transcriptional regulator